MGLKHDRFKAQAEAAAGEALYTPEEAATLLSVLARQVRVRMQEGDEGIVRYLFRCPTTSPIAYYTKASIDSHPHRLPDGVEPSDGNSVEAKARILGAWLKQIHDQGFVTIREIAAETSRSPGLLRRWAAEIAFEKKVSVNEVLMTGGPRHCHYVTKEVADALALRSEENPLVRRSPEEVLMDRRRREAPANQPAPLPAIRPAPKEAPPSPRDGLPPSDLSEPGYHLALMQGREACSDKDNPRPLGFLICKDKAGYSFALVGSTCSGDVVDRNIFCGGRWMRCKLGSGGHWGEVTEGVAIDWKLIPKAQWPPWKVRMAATLTGGAS